MAKIQEQSVVITVSKLVKDNAELSELISDDITAALQSVAEELLGDSVVVEVTKP